MAELKLNLKAHSWGTHLSGGVYCNHVNVMCIKK